MKILPCLLLVFLLLSCGETVTKKEFQSPDKIWGKLFSDIQEKRLFDEPKVFADAVPRYDAKLILANYEKEKTKGNFDLKKFVNQNFTLPNYSVEENSSKLEFEKYIRSSFLALKREPEDDKGSLIPTRKSYFAGGGKFEEFNYFRSYFVSKALVSMSEDTLALNQAINCAQFIQDFGHVLSGNRTYLVSRSNPPVFAMMIKQLAKKDPKTLEIFGTQLTREYQYWMSSEAKEDVLAQKEAVQKGEKVYRKVVFMPQGNLLNRYYDIENGSLTEKSYVTNAKIDFYENLRAAEESEWIGIRRWSDNNATEVLPIELNALLFYMEKTLSEVYKAKGKVEYAKSFDVLAEKRKAIFNKYFWNEEDGFYFDYNFKSQKSSQTQTLASIFPLLVGLASTAQADAVAKKLESQFLEFGGLKNEIGGNEYGAAEMQFFAIEALKKYGKEHLAQKIKDRWLSTNREYFAKFGRIEPIYDVRQPLHSQKNSQQFRIDGSLSVLLLLLKNN